MYVIDGLHFEPCGSPSPTRENLVQHKLVARQDPRPLDEKIVIDTYFHLIYSKEHSVHDFDKLYEEQVSTIFMQRFLGKPYLLR